MDRAGSETILTESLIGLPICSAAFNILIDYDGADKELLDQQALLIDKALEGNYTSKLFQLPFYERFRYKTVLSCYNPGPGL